MPLTRDLNDHPLQPTTEPRLVPLTPAEISLITEVLNAVPVKGLANMRAFLTLQEKLATEA